MSNDWRNNEEFLKERATWHRKENQLVGAIIILSFLLLGALMW
jgi:hypothetical protein